MSLEVLQYVQAFKQVNENHNSEGKRDVFKQKARWAM